MKEISILLADDHAVVRSGLKAMLDLTDDLRVVGEAADGREAVGKASRLRPDVVVMDLMMPQLDGSAATREIVATNPKVRVLVLTSYGTPDELRRALDAGALGILMKTASGRELQGAIRKVAAGRRHVPSDIAAELAAAEPPPILTERDRELLTAAARGLTNGDIALAIGVSSSTVKQQLSTVFKKLGVATRAEAVATALRHRLIGQ